MSSLAQNVLGTGAFCSLTAQVGPVFAVNRGFASVVRNGAGDYSLTLSDAFALNTQGLVRLTLQSAAFASGAVEIVSATVLRVRTALLTVVPAVTATDISFWIEVLEAGPT